MLSPCPDLGYGAVWGTRSLSPLSVCGLSVPLRGALKHIERSYMPWAFAFAPELGCFWPMLSVFTSFLPLIERTSTRKATNHKRRFSHCHRIDLLLSPSPAGLSLRSLGLPVCMLCTVVLKSNVLVLWPRVGWLKNGLEKWARHAMWLT